MPRGVVRPAVRSSTVGVGGAAVSVASMLMTFSPVLSVAVSWCRPRRSRTNRGPSSGPVRHARQVQNTLAGLVFRVAGLGEPVLLGQVADVDPGEVHELERAHRVSSAVRQAVSMSSTEEMPFSSRKIASSRTAPRIRLATNPGISWSQHHRRLARVGGPVRRPRSRRRRPTSAVPGHLDAAHHQRRVEEVHVGDAVRAPGGVGELRRHDRRRVRGEDRVRRRDLVEVGEDLPLDVQLLDGGFDHEVRGRRGRRRGPW